MMKNYRISDDACSDTVQAETMAEAIDIAKATTDVEPGARLTLRITECDADGEDIDGGECEQVTLECPAEEPPCIDGEEHDWQSPLCLVGGLAENPGVHGHGGGVYITEVCIRCGCKRVTDTWAQDPSNGEQGFESIEYEPEFFADRLDELEED